MTESPIADRREELTADWTDHQDPRPATLATQEVRLALAFTGGVSLAVWMGGVARELSLLVNASDRRRTPMTEEGPIADPLQRYYRRLMNLTDVQVSIDVLAGTSAGGINAAILGLANARRLDTGVMRDIWLEDGDIGRLLRNPREKSPNALLEGDKGMLVALNQGIRDLIGQAPAPDDPRRTDVMITTTLLSPEKSSFVDDYGTLIGDDDHHALFRFSEKDLVQDTIAAPLALAARSGSSFPGAFEPSFLPYGPDAVDPRDPLHPDMAPYFSATRSHWAADGVLLVNRPLAPLLESIFDRDADREVRRTLLYVVPYTSAPKPVPPDERSKPMTFGGALARDITATLDQSITADLTAIREHNDRIRARADIRLRLATLGSRLPAGTPLADADAWAAYRSRQREWLAERGDPLARATDDWPAATPADAAASLAAAVELGRPAFDAAKATVLRLLRLGYVLAADVEHRYHLARLGTRTMQPGGVPLAVAWAEIRDVVADAIPLLGELATTASGTRECAADEIRHYLAYFARTDPVTSLLDLHVATRSIIPVRQEVDQPVELVQVSAGTASLLAPGHRTPASKLTGLQMHHFGAFYKASWRANDWMWGRLDGCGWLVHVLLDPRRILAVLQNDGIPPAERVATFAASLGRALDRPVPPDLLPALAFLGEDDPVVPACLPDVAIWAAETLQRHIAAEELPIVAERLAEDKPVTSAARGWLKNFVRWRQNGALPADRDVPALLESCPVAAETLAREARAVTPRYLRTVTQAAAVATAAVAGFPGAPRTLRPIMATARTVSLTVNAAASAAGNRLALAGIGAAMTLVGVLAMLTPYALLNTIGVVGCLAGLVTLVISLGRGVLGVLGLVTALALIAVGSVPWIPMLSKRFFPWLGGPALTWVREERWPWPVFLLLLLLPAFSALAGLAAVVKPRRRPVAVVDERPRPPARAAASPAVQPREPMTTATAGGPSFAEGTP